jgi:hypothetical protein
MNKHLQLCDEFPVRCSDCKLITTRAKVDVHRIVHENTVKCVECSEYIAPIDFFTHYELHTLIEEGENVKEKPWILQFEQEPECKEDKETWIGFLEKTGKKHPDLSYSEIEKMWKNMLETNNISSTD